MIEVRCVACNVSFSTYPSKINDGNGRYCSRRCMGEHRRRKITVACEVCEEDFQVKPSRKDSGGGRYCSRKCSISGRTVPVADRFRRSLAAPDENGCVLWLGAKNPGGYGVICSGKHQQIRATHRVAWELANGPIPDGLCVLHRCDVRACCNPAHLFLGTNAENTADKLAKGRQPRGETHPRSRLTADDVRSIRERFSKGEVSRRSLAKEFRVSSSTVDNIINEVTWIEQES